MERPRGLATARFQALSDRHFSFEVEDPLLAGAAPGQFAMIWVARGSLSDEVPMAVSLVRDGRASFLVQVHGDGTAALRESAREGGPVGARGPYGRPFHLPPRGRLLLVGGGTGTATIARTVQVARAQGLSCTAILGARTARWLPLVPELEALGATVEPTTDDGSRGAKGTTVDRLERLLAEDPKWDLLLACGPEPMMHKVALLGRAQRLPVQVALERWMKCGFGLCGSCVLDGGTRVCVEGPCLTGEAALAHSDFGAAMREPDGSLRRLPAPGLKNP